MQDTEPIDYTNLINNCFETLIKDCYNLNFENAQTESSLQESDQKEPQTQQSFQDVLEILSTFDIEQNSSYISEKNKEEFYQLYQNLSQLKSDNSQINSEFKSKFQYYLQQLGIETTQQNGNQKQTNYDYLSNMQPNDSDDGMEEEHQGFNLQQLKLHQTHTQTLHEFLSVQ